jgi:uncharacterized OsmC-like protein
LPQTGSPAKQPELKIESSQQGRVLTMPQMQRFERDNIQLEGDIDLQGFLGIRDDVPRGYKEIRMFVKIDADAPPEKLEEIVNLGPTYSPVFDTFTRGVPVSVQLDN